MMKYIFNQFAQTMAACDLKQNYSSGDGASLPDSLLRVRASDFTKTAGISQGK